MNDKRRNKTPTGTRLASGIGFGLAGGLAMATIAMIRSALLGLGFWLPVKNIAATFLGVEALIGSAGAVMLGLILHIVMSAGLGALFTSIVSPKISTAMSILSGIAFGILVWAATTGILLPLINQVMLDRVLVAPGWWFAIHVVFGVIVGFAPVAVREASRGRPHAPRREPMPTGA